MDGVILAGGKGMRMRPLTLHTPKPLLHLQGRPILQWSLMSLSGVVDRVIVVVHYLKEQIAEFMAAQQIIQDFQLVEQLPEPQGTGHALRCCRDLLQGDDFLVVNGDDLYASAALHQLSRQAYGILSLQRADYHRYGVIVRNDAGDFLRIDEKPPRGRYPAPAPCSIGAYKFRAGVFDFDLEKTERGEYEITDYLTALAPDHSVAIVDSPFWLPIGDPAALDAAETVDIERWIPHAPADSARFQK